MQYTIQYVTIINPKPEHLFAAYTKPRSEQERPGIPDIYFTYKNIPFILETLY